MTIELYKNSSDVKRVDKNLTLLITLDSAKLYKDFDVINPTIIVSRETFDAIKNDCNYCYIPDFKRYYFLTYTYESNLVRLSCKLDERATYKTALRSLTATITRNENIANGYLHDANYSVYAYEQVTCKMFPRSINDDSIILMTVG